MRGGWIWGTYALALAWVGFLFIHVDRFWEGSRAETFRREGRRLVEVWADRIADAETAERRETLLRRFAGDLDSRSVALFDNQGRIIQNVGEPSPPLPHIPFSEPTDRSLNGDTWAFWAPLWVDGRCEGSVAWVRDSSLLKREKTHSQRGLLAGWAWWAVAGALGSAFAARPNPPS